MIQGGEMAGGEGSLEVDTVSKRIDSGVDVGDIQETAEVAKFPDAMTVVKPTRSRRVSCVAAVGRRLSSLHGRALGLYALGDYLGAIHALKSLVTEDKRERDRRRSRNRRGKVDHRPRAGEDEDDENICQDDDYDEYGVRIVKDTVAGPGALVPHVYGSLGLMYQGLLEQRRQEFLAGSSSDNGDDVPLSEERTRKYYTQRLGLLRRAYGSLQAAAVLYGRDTAAWIRSGDAAVDLADHYAKYGGALSGRACDDDSKGRGGCGIGSVEQQRRNCLRDAAYGYSVADSCLTTRYSNPLVILMEEDFAREEEVVYKLSGVLLQLGRIMEAMAILTDWRDRGSDRELHLKFARSREKERLGELNGNQYQQQNTLPWSKCPHISMLFANLMLRIGYECFRWDEGGGGAGSGLGNTILTMGNGEEGEKRGEPYMLRRWLRKFATLYDWKGNRAYALAGALVGFLGSEAGEELKNYFVFWKEDREKKWRENFSDWEEKEQSKNKDDDSDKGNIHQEENKGKASQKNNNERQKTTNNPSDPLDQSEEATTKKTSEQILNEEKEEKEAFDRDRADLLRSNAEELVAFDIITGKHHQKENSGHERQQMREALVKSHRAAVVNLVGSFYQKSQKKKQAKKLAEMMTKPQSSSSPPKIPMPHYSYIPPSASFATACNIASQLIRVCISIKNYRGGRLVAEAIFSYHRIRSERRKRKRTHALDKEYKSWMSGVATGFENTNASQSNDNGCDSALERDDLLSDDGEFNAKEDETPATWQTTSFIWPEIYVLYGLCLLGEGHGNDFLGVAALGRMVDLEQETVHGVEATLQEMEEMECINPLSAGEKDRNEYNYIDGGSGCSGCSGSGGSRWGDSAGVNGSVGSKGGLVLRNGSCQCLISWPEFALPNLGPVRRAWACTSIIKTVGEMDTRTRRTAVMGTIQMLSSFLVTNNSQAEKTFYCFSCEDSNEEHNDGNKDCYDDVKRSIARRLVHQGRARAVMGVSVLYLNILKNHGDLDIREGVKHADTAIQILIQHWKILWDNEVRASANGVSVEAISYLSGLLEWVEGKASQMADAEVKLFLTHAANIIKELCGPYEKDFSLAEDTTKTPLTPEENGKNNATQETDNLAPTCPYKFHIWRKFPVPGNWQGRYHRTISHRLVQLLIGCNVSDFSGWTVAPYDLTDKRKQMVSYFRGIKRIGLQVTGPVSSNVECRVPPIWTCVRSVLPQLCSLNFVSTLSKLKKMQWYLSTLSRHRNLFNSRKLALCGEDFAVDLFVSYASLSIAYAARVKDCARRFSLVANCMSVLLPISQFSLDRTLWQSQIGAGLSERPADGHWENFLKSRSRININRDTPEFWQRATQNKRRRCIPSFASNSDVHSIRAPPKQPLKPSPFVVSPKMMLDEWRSGDDDACTRRTLQEECTPEESSKLMRLLDFLVNKLKKNSSIDVQHRISIEISSTLLEIASLKNCHNPFLLLNQAAVFASQGKSGMRSLADIIKRSLPSSEESCSAIQAIVITGRADCLRLLGFEDDANFLCAYVARVCCLRRHSMRPEMLQPQWNQKWMIVGIQNSIIKSLINRGYDFSEDVLIEFEDGKKDSINLCDKLKNDHQGNDLRNTEDDGNGNFFKEGIEENGTKTIDSNLTTKGKEITPATNDNEIIKYCGTYSTYQKNSGEDDGDRKDNNFDDNIVGNDTCKECVPSCDYDCEENGVVSSETNAGSTSDVEGADVQDANNNNDHCRLLTKAVVSEKKPQDLYSDSGKSSLENRRDGRKNLSQDNGVDHELQISKFKKRRLENIERNRAYLSSVGLGDKHATSLQEQCFKLAEKEKKKKVNKNAQFNLEPCRRSLRQNMKKREISDHLMYTANEQLEEVIIDSKVYQEEYANDEGDKEASFNNDRDGGYDSTYEYADL